MEYDYYFLEEIPKQYTSSLRKDDSQTGSQNTSRKSTMHFVCAHLEYKEQPQKSPKIIFMSENRHYMYVTFSHLIP